MAHTFKQTRKYRQGYHKVDKASPVELSFLLLGKVFCMVGVGATNLLGVRPPIYEGFIDWCIKLCKYKCKQELKG